jgi:hypothetical protein
MAACVLVELDSGEFESEWEEVEAELDEIDDGAFSGRSREVVAVFAVVFA